MFRTFSFCGGVFASGVFVSGAFASCLIQAQERPNILYIMTDQQTATAMSCMGNADLHTPNMDRLARQGVVFTNAYCSAPLSGPARASMFTGYYPEEIGLERNNVPIPDSVRTRTLGTLLSRAGYECAYAGKWHAHTASMPDGEFGFTTLHPHNDNGLAEACVGFLNGRHTRPFFLVASFDNPHNVCEYARCQNLPFGNIPEAMPDAWPGLPANFARQPYDADATALERDRNFNIYPTTYYTPDDWRRYRYTYYRLVEKVDREIGKILDALDRCDLWRNTVVIFTSDHGDGIGAHGWNQKSALYEEVVNIPLIVVNPGQRNAGSRLPQLISNGVDFFASICDWAGCTPPSSTCGVSFRQVAEKGEPAAVHQSCVVTETLFNNGIVRGWAVRTERYKYVLYDRGRYREQLYDLQADRGEMRNLAVEQAFRSVLQQHRELLRRWMKQHRVKQTRVDVPVIPE